LRQRDRDWDSGEEELTADDGRILEGDLYDAFQKLPVARVERDCFILLERKLAAMNLMQAFSEGM